MGLPDGSDVGFSPQDTAFLSETESAYRSDGGCGVFETVGASQRGILEAWLTLIEGLVGAVATCPRSFQVRDVARRIGNLSPLSATHDS